MLQTVSHRIEAGTVLTAPDNSSGVVVTKLTAMFVAGTSGFRDSDVAVTFVPLGPGGREQTLTMMNFVGYLIGQGIIL